MTTLITEQSNKFCQGLKQSFVCFKTKTGKKFSRTNTKEKVYYKDTRLIEIFDLNIKISITKLKFITDASNSKFQINEPLQDWTPAG